MKNLKESCPLEICVRYYKISNTIYFYAKNDFTFTAHKYFLKINLIEEYNGIFKSGIFLDLNEILNLKQFKIEIFD